MVRATNRALCVENILDKRHKYGIIKKIRAGSVYVSISQELIEDCMDITDRKLKQLNKKGIKTVGDLVRFLPRRYEDRSNILQPKDFPSFIGQKISIIGQIESIKADYIKNYFTATVNVGANCKVAITWFHQNYLIKSFFIGDKYLFYGKLEYNPKYGFKITSPTFFSKEISQSSTPLPVYSKIAGMSTEYLQDCIDKALIYLKANPEPDSIDEELLEALKIDTEIDFLQKAHHPQNMDDVKSVAKRKTAEALIPFSWELLERQYKGKKETDKITNDTAVKQNIAAFENTLLFSLTKDQKQTVNQMLYSTSNGKRLDALVQGDVGCGKTIVAIEMALAMYVSGMQTAVMAPTSILAEQHFNEFSERLEPFGANIALLGGKLKSKEKRELYAKIESGEINIVIGTHAVISDDVKFHNLGLTIVDEEHRFGVAQRNQLRKKAMEGAHSISMSATPIPRTLALALYGDNTVIYNIKTMPSGRKPVQTIAYTDENRTYEALYRQIQKGRQAYIVCPLITNSDAMEDVDSLEETFENCKAFYANYPEVHIACINGKMKQEEIYATIDSFKNKEVDILLSTTIVEVGVNVPNATVMVVKNAERFGLAQLHQLRGRVGRGNEQAFCVLLTKDKQNPRIQAMVQTNDGFEIAKIDLEQRGTGNFVGEEQSGFDEAVDLMIRMPGFYNKISTELNKIYKAKLRYEHYSELFSENNALS